MIPDHQDKPKGRVGRSKSARTALLDALRASNAGVHFKPLVQEEYDSFIKTVPRHWHWAYQKAFEVAMTFELDGKSGRAYWFMACGILNEFEQLEMSVDRANPTGLGGLFSALRDTLPPETSIDRDNPTNQGDFPNISTQLRKTVISIFDCITIFYNYSISNLMRMNYSPPGKRTRKSIPTAEIEQLKRRYDKTPYTEKGQIVQTFADEYKVSTQTILRRFKSLTPHPEDRAKP